MTITRNESPDNLNVSSIDNEHRVQIGLINALYDSTKAEKSAAEIAEIVNQLTAYSELHFMSEELLMRMYAYPDYDDHVQDHEILTEHLNAIVKTSAAGKENMILKTASDMRQFLVSHIATRDQALTEYLLKVQG